MYRFGTRAKSVKNAAVKNEEKSAAELTAMLLKVFSIQYSVSNVQYPVFSI